MVPNKIINTHWNVLQINSEFKKHFRTIHFMAFKRNKNLQEITGDHTNKNEKVFKALKPIQKNRKGK